MTTEATVKTIATENVAPTELAELEAFVQASLSPDSDLTALLTHVVTAMRDGIDLAVIAPDAELSPNQAAAFLKMSRPHLLKLLDHGFIPFHRVGSDRRIKNRDLISYLQRRDEARQRMAYVNAHHSDIEMEAAMQDSGLDPKLLSELT